MKLRDVDVLHCLSTEDDAGYRVFIVECHEVTTQRIGQRAGEVERVSVDCDIEVVQVAAEQRVADGATDGVRPQARSQRGRLDTRDQRG